MITDKKTMLSINLTTPQGNKTIGGITTEKELSWALKEIEKRALRELGVIKDVCV